MNASTLQAQRSGNADTVTTSPPRLSVFRLMDDKQLEAAVADLQVKVSQLGFACGPVPRAVREAYVDALDQARAEVERRRA